MDPQVQNDSTMSYGHIPLPDRRDNIDTNVSTPFQSHQSLGQALGTHLPSSNRTYQDSYRVSPSPSLLHPQNGGPSSQNHPGAGPSHSPLTFSVPAAGHASPPMKRKQVDSALGGHMLKRRRETDDGDSFDVDGGGQGAKHWTDEEKSKLFNWLMGPGQDDHWNSLRATKNSCLRECAVEVFESKKTYQALKGCYERNFNLFKQIYAFESYNAHAGSGNVSALSEADRLREYERRLQAARKAGCDVGNITARAIDHWHRIGWYELFYRRWHGDPATTRPVIPRHPAAGGTNSAGGEDPDGEDDPGLDFSDPSTMNGLTSMNGMSHDRQQFVSSINPQALRETMPPPTSPPATTHHTPHPPALVPSGARDGGSSGGGGGTGDPPLVNIALTQNMMATYLQFIQAQTQTSKMKLEYLRRREEREERESAQRRELERQRSEREAAEWEHTKQQAKTKQKADRAIEILDNPAVDPSVKQAAGDYLKKLLLSD